MTPIPFNPKTSLHSPQVGCIAGEPDDFYHAVPFAVTSSRLGTLLESPREWLDRFEQEVVEPARPTDDLIFGRAYHAYVLEGPEALARQFRFFPRPLESKQGGRDGAAWREFRKECDALGVYPYDHDTWQKLLKMRDRLLEDPVNRAMLEQSAKELVWRGVDQTYAMPTLFQARTDAIGTGEKGQRVWHGRPFILDPKTATESDFRSFTRSFRSGRYGYHRQAAFYLGAVKLLGGPPDPDFVFLKQSKTPPYAWCRHPVSSEALKYGAREIKAGLELLAECRQSGVWPLQTSDEGEELDLADYVYETAPETVAVRYLERIRHGARMVPRVAALAGTTPEALLEGAR